VWAETCICIAIEEKFLCTLIDIDWTIAVAFGVVKFCTTEKVIGKT